MNPELLRNLWLELSIRRLIAMPLVLAIVFAAPLIREQPHHDIAPPTVMLFESPFPDADTSVAVSTEANLTLGLPTTAATMLYRLMLPGAVHSTIFSGLIFSVTIAVLLFLWGTRLAADSLFSEVTGRTWDSQRNSTIGPWAMTLGKLFGGTAYVWYGAAFCIAFWGYLQFYRPSTVAAVLLAGLWTQALALFVALLLLRMAPDRTRFRVTFAQTVVLPVAALLLYGFSNQTGVTYWYALALPGAWVMPISFALAAGWTLIGINQLMRSELQLTTRPIAWIGFLLMLGLYAGGFAFRPGIILSAGWSTPLPAAFARSLLLAATVIVLLAPISALLSPPRLLPLRRLLSPGQSMPTKWRDLPPWTWSLLFSGVLIFAASILEALGGGTTFFGTILDGPAALAALLLLLFALRDIGILHLMSIDPASRRGVLATLVILALSYIVLPILAKVAHAADLIPIFRPDFFAPAGHGIAIVLIDCVFVWLLAGRLYRRLARRLPAIVLAGLFLAASSPVQAAPGSDGCPRTTAHEMLKEAGIVFEGHLLSQGPPPECAANKMFCDQQVLTFRIDRLLKGDGKVGATVTARRVPLSQMPLSASDPQLAVPDSGLFVLAGQPSGQGFLNMMSYQDDDEEGEGMIIPGNYTIDECLLGLPPGIAAEAEAYADKKNALISAGKNAPADPGTVVALADYLLRNRDAAVAPLLEQAVIAFPANQAIRAQFLYRIDQAGVMTRNMFFWNGLKTGQPALAQALVMPAKPDPDNIWVKLLAIRIRGRPAEPNSPLAALKDFSSYSFNGLQYADASLPGMNLTDTHIANSDFRGSDLTGANLRWAEFENVDLSFARLSDADLQDWNPSTRMGSILLRRFMMAKAGSGETQPVVMNMFTLNLRRTTFDRARMDRATLIGANLREASLRQVVLRDADLRQADLRGADLTGADITGAVLDEARFDCRTKWPIGFTPAARPDPASDTALCTESIVARH